MAGERVGKTYEAILKVVLDRLKEKRVFEGEVFWNETPDSLSVEPDFSIGKDINHPSFIVMVTHTESAKNSDMKCWRNLGELCEAKSFLTPIPSAINIVFDAVMKDSLKRLQASAFDKQLLIGEKEYSKELFSWVLCHESSLPIDQEEKAHRIALSADPSLQKIMSNIEADLLTVFVPDDDDLAALWSLERIRTRKEIPTAKNTCVRRGLSKLMIFDNIDLAIRLYRGKKVSANIFPEYVYIIGLAKKAIGRAVPIDSEIQSAVDLLTDIEIKDICGFLANSDTMQVMVNQLRNVSSINIMATYVLNNYDRICDGGELLVDVQLLHNDPKALVPTGNQGWPPGDVWLISILLEMIKASTNRSNGYGIAQLAHDVITAGYGTEKDMSDATQFGGGLGFSSWMLRRKTTFRDDLLKGVCVVLSSKITEIGYEQLGCIAKEIVNKYINNLLEAKVCTYRMFEPLYMLMEKQIKGIKKVSYRTCFAEKSELTRMAGKTTVAQVKHTIINWQTATDAGRDHKRKELCGRAIGLRYTWNAEKKQFEPRPGVQKLILLLDGTWRQKDLDALVRAGWDEIYYPDEIDQLKKAIV